MKLIQPPFSGQIIMCDYKGFVVPEIVKRRPVIVISPKARRSLELCAVVPLSTSKPHKMQAHHLEITMTDTMVATGKFAEICWAKCDLVNTVSLARLELIRLGKGVDGKRKYSFYRIPQETLEAVRNAVCFCLTGKN